MSKPVAWIPVRIFGLLAKGYHNLPISGQPIEDEPAVELYTKAGASTDREESLGEAIEGVIISALGTQARNARDESVPEPDSFEVTNRIFALLPRSRERTGDEDE